MAENSAGVVTFSARLFPLRLAWAQLRHEPRKLAAGVAGVVFAVLLMFMQLGFRDAMFDSATAVQRRMPGDLFIIQRESQTLWRMAPFSRRRVLQALALPEVEQAGYLYVSLADWKNPWNGRHRPALLFGIDPIAGMLQLPGVPEQLAAIKDEDTVLFDAHSHTEFGPVPEIVGRGEPLHAEVNHRRVEVRGLFDLGASFTADGNLVASHENFLRLMRDRRPYQADVGVLRLRSAADVRAVQRALGALLPNDVRVLTQEEFIRLEHDFWQNATGIGFVFTLGTLMGFLVGVVIVYQILYTEIANHLAQYATLSAIGYTHRFLLAVVAGAALLLSVLGFIPGFLLSNALYGAMQRATFLPMFMYASNVATVFSLTLLMCFLSGGLALRKLRDADPADLF
jgi:putative ABC transport system permease protein